jgi:hypothetical protein
MNGNSDRFSQYDLADLRSHINLRSSKYRVIHKSLLSFRTRLPNNQDRHSRKQLSSTCKVGQTPGVFLPLLTCPPSVWPPRLVYCRGRKSRRDLRITLYKCSDISPCQYTELFTMQRSCNANSVLKILYYSQGNVFVNNCYIASLLCKKKRIIYTAFRAIFGIFSQYFKMSMYLWDDFPRSP